MILVEVTVEGDPIAKGRPRHGKGGRTYTPARTEAAENALAWQLLHARRGNAPSSRPVRVSIGFYCKTRRRCDIDNLAKLVLDAANGVIYDDDQQVEVLVVSVKRGMPCPATHVLITEEDR